ncbi:hypothetical protein [Spirosoma litoris]
MSSEPTPDPVSGLYRLNAFLNGPWLEIAASIPDFVNQMRRNSFGFSSNWRDYFVKKEPTFSKEEAEEYLNLCWDTDEIQELESLVWQQQHAYERSDFDDLVITISLARYSHKFTMQLRRPDYPIFVDPSIIY